MSKSFPVVNYNVNSIGYMLTNGRTVVGSFAMPNNQNSINICYDPDQQQFYLDLNQQENAPLIQGVVTMRRGNGGSYEFENRQSLSTAGKNITDGKIYLNNTLQPCDEFKLEKINDYFRIDNLTIISEGSMFEMAPNYCLGLKLEATLNEDINQDSLINIILSSYNCSTDMSTTTKKRRK